MSSRPGGTRLLEKNERKKQRKWKKVEERKGGAKKQIAQAVKLLLCKYEDLSEIHSIHIRNKA